MPRNTKTKRTTRRPNVPQETLERARAELRGEAISQANPTEFPAAPKVAGSAASPRPASAAKLRRSANNTLATRRVPLLAELLTEYRYVTHDLRNLAILAGALLVTILVVSLLLSRAV